MLHIQQMSKIYEGKVPYRALTDIHLTVDEGEFVAVMGPSGSGKTTLLNTIATIDEPTTGDIFIDGDNPYQYNKNKLAKFRRQSLGFVFQDFNLLHTLTVEENIVLPLTLDYVNVKEMEKRVKSIAKMLGIEHILSKRTYEISGGQAQRVAIARAMIHQPKLVLADEPTGNLDSKASKDVMQLLSMMNEEQNTTLLLVTHEAQAAMYADRVIFIRDGKLYSEIYQEGDRQVFFQKIIDTLSAIGGNAYDI